MVEVKSHLRLLFLRLFMESYFDLAICSALGTYAFAEVEDFSEFGEFWSNRSNIWNSTVTILGAVGCIIFPCWAYLTIKKNFKTLDHKENRENFGMLYEEQKIDKFASA